MTIELDEDVYRGLISGRCQYDSVQDFVNDLLRNHLSLIDAAESEDDDKRTGEG